jgi:hypothetical protein
VGSPVIVFNHKRVRTGVIACGKGHSTRHKPSGAIAVPPIPKSALRRTGGDAGNSQHDRPPGTTATRGVMAGEGPLHWIENPLQTSSRKSDVRHP